VDFQDSIYYSENWKTRYLSWSIRNSIYNQLWWKVKVLDV
jgi:hypothetical protein